MAIAIQTPTHDQLYILHNGLSQDVAITFTSTTDVNVDISYTYDLTGTPTEVTIENNVNVTLADGVYSYTWTPTDTDKLNLTGSATEAPTLAKTNTITVHETGNAGNTGTMDIKCQRSTFSSLMPDNTIAPIDEYPFYRKDDINITWEEDFTTGIEPDLSNVIITVAKDGGTTETIAATYERSLKHIVWNPYRNTETRSQVTGMTTSVKFTVRVASINQPGNYIESYFYICNEPDGTGSVIEPIYRWWKNMRSRIDFMSRTAGEKAVLVDEHPVLAQFEAGTGITITQRDKTGKRVNNGSDAVALQKAYNLVIAVDPAEIDTMTKPRYLEGYLNFVQDGIATSVVDDPNLNPDWYYGELRYIDIPHGWSLALPTNTSAWSFHLEINQISNDGSRAEGEILSMPILGSNVYWEVIDSDTIRVYCMVKGSSYNASQAKDQFTANGQYNGGLQSNACITYNSESWLSKYVFYYRLEEKIPD